jgi:ABC-type polysaccharide/polyol phosphate export permease
MFLRIYKYRYVLVNLVRQDLKNKYRNSWLGVGWSLASPIGLVAIIGAVFSVVLKQSINDFLPYLYSGLIPWMYFVACADGGSYSFINAEGYIKQTQTPLEIFPIRMALVPFVQLLYSLVAYFIMFLFLKPEKFSLTMLMVPISLLIWLLLGISVSYLAASLHTYFRDYAPMQSLVLQGLFYATPIMYPAETIKGNFSWIVKYNPIYYFLEIIRHPLLGEPLPSLHEWFIVLGVLTFILLLSIIINHFIGRKFIFRL